MNRSLRSKNSSSRKYTDAQFVDFAAEAHFRECVGKGGINARERFYEHLGHYAQKNLHPSSVKCVNLLHTLGPKHSSVQNLSLCPHIKGAQVKTDFSRAV